MVHDFCIPARASGRARAGLLAAAVAGFAGFAVLGFFTAVSPLFLGQVLHETTHVVTGLTVFALVLGLAPTAVVFAGIVALLAVGAFVSLLGRPR